MLQIKIQKNMDIKELQIISFLDIQIQPINNGYLFKYINDNEYYLFEYGDTIDINDDCIAYLEKHNIL